MSARIQLGAGVDLDLPRLIETKLLLQANSGGGKSWAVRRLLEQTHGKVQHLVIDPEGEFSSLREKFDYVLAARHGGDTAADPRSAALLAERLLELGVSAILDIYELKPHERVSFVRRFVEALVDAPKSLWHPALVVIDEAHVYCPQTGEAESANAVKDLATRGRKRGFCAVLATQRLSKLHKDAAAELNNKLIGRTSLDIDAKRAADELGFTTKDEVRSLRTLDDGQWFAYGPALSNEVRKVHVGPVATSHPKVGARIAFAAPPPTEKVRALLPKLADLPAEVEERAKSLSDLKSELARTKKELAVAHRAQPPAPEPKVIERLVLKDAQVARLEALATKLVDIATAVSKLGAEVMAALRVARQPAPASRAPARAPTRPVSQLRAVISEARGASERLPKCERAILGVLAQHGASSLSRIALLSGYRSNGGGFRNALSALRTAGLVQGSSDAIALTAAGDEATAEFAPLPSGAELVEHWRRSFGGCERKIIDALIDHPNGLDIDGLAAATGYASGGGGFRNALSSLRTAGVLLGRSGAALRLCDELLDAAREAS